MANPLYYIKRIKNMSFKGMSNSIKNVSSKVNKPGFIVFLDMAWCALRYGAGYKDYELIGFYKLNHKQRDSMITRGRNDKIVKKLNNKSYWHLFNNKNEFNTFFSKFIPRNWVYIDYTKAKQSKDIYKNEEFVKFKRFIGGQTAFFAKPNDGQCGKGILKIDTVNLDAFLKEHNIEVDAGYKLPKDGTIEYSVEMLKSDNGDLYNNRARGLFKFLLDNELYLLEQPIVQHEKMNELNPSSVNTCRLVSIMNEKNEVTILASFIRIGNGVNVVDNFNSGGMTAKVDVTTGKIMEDAVNKEGKVFEMHPLTNTKIKGFEIPFFEEAKNMVIEAAKMSTNVRYVGWDVAITENGPTLVEGNQYPGHDIYQVAEKLDEKSMGVWPEFKKALKA